MDFVYNVKAILEDSVILDLSGEISGMASGTITSDVEIDKESGVPLDSTINMLINISGQEMSTKVTIKTTKK